MKHRFLMSVCVLISYFSSPVFAQEDENQDEQQAQQRSATIKSSTQYDFVPGDKILFYEDFSQDALGDLPALWSSTTSGEVRTVENVPFKWLYFAAGNDIMCLTKKLALPENFIFEFDLLAVPAEDDENAFNMTITFFDSEEGDCNSEYLPGSQGFHIRLAADKWGISGYKDQDYINDGSESIIAPVPLNEPTHVIVWIQKKRVRIYHQGKKVLDGPAALPENIKLNRLRFWGGEQQHPYITNLKITTASPDMRNKLLTDGKLVTYGIYFDVNKDVVKSESTGTLKEIAKILNEVPDVKVKIVGHTDSDGQDAANLDLSKRRAASVKNELVKNFSVNGDRLVTDGLGESQPVAPNDTPANKALNRRVEFIKM